MFDKIELNKILDIDNHYEEVQPLSVYEFAGVYSFGKGLFKREPLSGNNTTYKVFNKLQKGNLVVSKVKGWEGAIALITEEFDGLYLSPVYPTFRANELFLDIRFLDYFCKQSKIWKSLLDNSRGIGARRNQISEEKFLSLEIPLPNIDEQKRIVQIIDSVKSRIELIKRMRAEQEKEIENLRYSIMTDFEKTSNKLTINSICNIAKGSFAIMQTLPGQYTFVVTGAEKKKAEHYDFDCEAVCIPLVSSTGHGNAALHRVHYQSGKFALSNLLCAVESKDKEVVLEKFLYELFSAKKDEYFVPLMKGTSNVSLSTDKIGSVSIPVPTIEEQKKVINLFEKFYTIRETYKVTLKELEELFPALLDKAFKGEL